MSPNVARLADLKQRAQLAEMIRHRSNIGLSKLSDKNDDCEKLVSSGAVLTKEVAKPQVHAVAHNDAAQQPARVSYYILQTQTEQHIKHQCLIATDVTALDSLQHGVNCNSQFISLITTLIAQDSRMDRSLGSKILTLDQYQTTLGQII